MRGKNRYQTPFIENVGDENVCGTPVDTQHRGGSEETDVLSPSSCSLPSPLVEIEWSTGQCSSTEVTFASKADEIRRKCRNSLLEKTPKILIERLKKEGCLLLKNLTVLEVRLVNHNPSVFNVYIDMDMPRCPVAKVRMVQEVDPEQLDLTGKSGNLRHAFDEEFADLTTSKLFFSRTREAVRKCAVMAFVPPRCFILCDEKGTQDEERLKSISESLE
ncbi:hypothetical protein GCK32_010085 [Trichostrongylus colubriformis]|uniref:Uncharacterized protein n=1 Tax=Trichostrongylus colubriformis TaxID=6319 RepID=A0AAN8FW08_TRICO